MRAAHLGIATFVMRGKQYLTALRAEDKVQVLQTLHWADEVRDPYGSCPSCLRAGRARARSWTWHSSCDSLSGPWERSRYRDTYRRKVRELVEAKAEGREIAAAEEASVATNVVDLMQALQGSIDQARGGPKKSSGRKPKQSEPGCKTARRPAAKKAKKAATRKAPPQTGRASADARGRRSAGKRELRQLSKAELYQRATEHDVPGRSKMSREELVEALARAGHRRKKSAA